MSTWTPFRITRKRGLIAKGQEWITKKLSCEWPMCHPGMCDSAVLVALVLHRTACTASLLALNEGVLDTSNKRYELGPRSPSHNLIT